MLILAAVYGNEAELGAAIEKSGAPRESLFVVTKLTSNKKQPTMACLDRSLSKLGLDHVDLYLMHAPFFAEGNKLALQAQWAEMEECKASGKAKSIGVSNYLQHHVEAILETAKIPPAINQIEYHPYLQHGDLVRFHRDKGIALSGYGPLTPIVRARPGPLDPVYERLASSYAVTEAEIALRWVIDMGIVAITTSSKEDRLKAMKATIPSFNLTPDEVQEIATVGNQKHYRAFWTSRFAPNDRS